jgi:hypothetical protein
MAAPGKDAPATGKAKPTTSVWTAMLTMESSRMTDTAAPATPTAPIRGGGTLTAEARMGSAVDVKSTIVGKSGNCSGPLAFTRIKILGLDVASLRAAPACKCSSNYAGESALLLFLIRARPVCVPPDFFP